MKIDPQKYTVKHVSFKVARDFIKTNHYSKGCHNGTSPNYGLFYSGEMIGCIQVATPCSENVRAFIFGKEHKDRVKELHRLFIHDGTPKNMESWFISKVLRQIRIDRPDLWALVSFADTTVGHIGTIYQATNALYYGMTDKKRFYIDQDGRLRHPRQQGVNISIKAAKEKGWLPTKRSAKHRYVFILGSKKQKKDRTNKLQIETFSYPEPIT